MNLKMSIMSPLKVVFERDSLYPDTYDPRVSLFDTLGMKLKFQIGSLSPDMNFRLKISHTHTEMNTDCGC